MPSKVRKQAYPRLEEINSQIVSPEKYVVLWGAMFKFSPWVGSEHELRTCAFADSGAFCARTVYRTVCPRVHCGPNAPSRVLSSFLNGDTIRMAALESSARL